MSDEMITVWIWWNTSDMESYDINYPEIMVYRWDPEKDTRADAVGTDLTKHPMWKEIEALAHLAGYDPNYPDNDASEDFTIPAEWWGNPETIKRH